MSLKEEYASWIDAYVASQPGRLVRGKCKEASGLMVMCFPELVQVCGFVETTWGEEQHWWCETSLGEVVDPTKSQYQIVFSYEKVDPNKPHRPVPIGVCANCGGPRYEDSTVCSKACGDDFARELNAELTRRN